MAAKKRVPKERITYDVETRVFRRFSNNIQTDWKPNVLCIVLGSLAWFVLLAPDEKLNLEILNQEIATPRDVYQIDMFVRHLYGLRPIACAINHDSSDSIYSNPLFDDLNEKWFATISDLEQSLAQEVRALLESDEGRERFLKHN